VSNKIADKYIIKKIDDEYVLFSRTSGRRVGEFDTRTEAEKRERQLQFYEQIDRGQPERRNRRGNR